MLQRKKLSLMKVSQSQNWKLRLSDFKAHTPVLNSTKLPVLKGYKSNTHF